MVTCFAAEYAQSGVLNSMTHRFEDLKNPVFFLYLFILFYFFPTTLDFLYYHYPLQ